MRLLLALTAALLLGAQCNPAAEPDPCDRDGDGYASQRAECGGDDCDDYSADTFPGATEICDGLDNDCDGLAPGIDGSDGEEYEDEVDEDDGDSDGWWDCEDCHPSNYSEHDLIGVDCPES